jgi:hypothetical protein
MSPLLAYDFQLGRFIRLRGWGWNGIIALVFLLFAVAALSYLAGPLSTAFGAGVLRLNSALKSVP